MRVWNNSHSPSGATYWGRSGEHTVRPTLDQYDRTTGDDDPADRYALTLEERLRVLRDRARGRERLKS